MESNASLHNTLSKIDYDLLGNPTRIQFSNFNVVEYVYTADGRRLKTIHRKAVPRSQSLLMGNTHTLTASETQSVDSTEYIGDFVFENNAFKQYHFEGGYITPSTSKYYVKDHLGNNRILASCTGAVEQATHYYPFGATHHLSTNQGVQKYKYNGKELDTMHGLNWYDYGARQYDPAIAQFTTVDPLCEKYYHISPYAYCGGNPVNRVDPDGRTYGDFVDSTGKIIGNDGLDDGKIYILRTTKSVYKESRYDTDVVPGANISKRSLKETISFIKSNNGNLDAFTSNSIAYDNSVEIESSQTNRESMINIISSDDGTRGGKDRNNREYGGSITAMGIVENEPGEISIPGQNAYIELDHTTSTFHSHPSGTIQNDQNLLMYTQHPSTLDITNAGSHTCYVFGRRNGITYIYNNNGVQATIPSKYFIKFKP